MNITAAILTIKEAFTSEELSEVLQHEREVIEQWKQAGYIHDMYLRQTKNGAVILFKVRAPVKLTTSVRSKLTTCFAGEDLSVHVC